MLEVTFEETYKESRKIDFNQENISQTIVGVLCGNFFEVAQQGQGGFYDDDTVVMKAAYQYFPVAYLVPIYSGYHVFLVLDSLKFEQINNTTWKITVVYNTPKKGGSGSGGTGQDIPNIGPDAGENNGLGWSTTFTQISVNASVSTRTRSHSLASLACQRSVNLPAGSVPYPQGKPAPIGHTLDGIKGAEVYEREFSFSITAYFPPARLKYAYVRMLSRLQTTLNRNMFFGFAPGSVLFLEYDFSGDVFQVVPVTFAFKQRNNFAFNQTLATRLADPFIEGAWDVFYEPDFEDTAIMSGWSEVDYRYAPVPDSGAVMQIQRPILRTIHQLYEYSDFNALGL